MQILIVVPRYNLGNEANYDYTFPLGLSYISAVMKKAGYSVDCLNLNHKTGTIKDLINKQLNFKKYDFVCTGSNALAYAIIEKILSTIKNHDSKPKTILGGPIITSEPELMFNSLRPDFAVFGEGEETIVELLNFIEKNKDISKVKGVIYGDKYNQTIKTEKREAIENLDSIPFPDFEGLGLSEQLAHLHSNQGYHSNLFNYPRIYPLLASRSCPFQCTFCYHDSKYRKRSMGNIMKELNIMVKKYKINILLIYDECLAVDEKRLLEFCKGIKKLKKEISWDLKWTGQMRVQNVSKELLHVMKEAGCDVISYGFESFSSEVLKSMRKGITPEQIDYAFKNTLAENIAVQAHFIFGDIAETKETARITLNYWKKYCRGQVGMGFIQPYPGSQIYAHCIKKGIIKDKLDFIKNQLGLGQWLNMTDKMTDKEITELKEEILDSMSKYTRFVRSLDIKRTGNKIYSVKAKCPFCGEISEYGNCLIPNRWAYGFNITCRHCAMRFFVVSFIQKLAYANYSKVRILRDLYLRLKRKILKERL